MNGDMLIGIVIGFLAGGLFVAQLIRGAAGLARWK